MTKMPDEMWNAVPEENKSVQTTVHTNDTAAGSHCSLSGKRGHFNILSVCGTDDLFYDHFQIIDHIMTEMNVSFEITWVE